MIVLSARAVDEVKENKFVTLIKSFGDSNIITSDHIKEVQFYIH